MKRLILVAGLAGLLAVALEAPSVAAPAPELAVLTLAQAPAAAPAAAPAVVFPDPEADPLGLIAQVVGAVRAKNWLLAVPLLLLGAVWALRKYGARAWPWLATNKGGAALAIFAAAVTAVLSAVLAPGPHSLAQVLSAAVGLLLANQLLFAYLKKLLAPTGADDAQDAVKLAELAAVRGGGAAVANAALGR